MEPRIATLVDFPRQEEGTLHSILLIPPSPTTRRPQLVDIAAFGERALLPGPGSEDSGENHYDRAQTHKLLVIPKPGAPIAQVLNDEGPLLYASQPSSTTFTPSAPFSGRLIDLLLESPGETQKRREPDLEQSLVPRGLIGSQNSVIKLPKLPQLPRRTTRRPRIPPLLQGLHQPPPLPPEDELFPPITGAKTGFASNLGERAGYDTRVDVTRHKEDEHAINSVGATEPSRSILLQESHKVDIAAPTVPLPRPPVLLGVVELASKQASGAEPRHHKRGKPQNRWSDHETRDLLLGVSKYGIGNWKRILQSPDFLFTRRTAVDLKDRFRVCCPGEGLKARASRRKAALLEEHPTGSLGATQTTKPPSVFSREKATDDDVDGQKSNGDKQRHTHSGIMAEVAELGIRGPFLKSTRRARRKFSPEDDKNLLKGFEKHGSTWHAMRDDPELCFAARHPTDLRDRFRIRFPEKFAKAGFKLKEKEQRIVEGLATKYSTNEVVIPIHSLNNAAQPSHEGERPSLYTASNGVLTNTACFLPKASKLQPHGYMSYLSEAISDLVGEDTISEDGNAEEGPITLNRNILQWADANPSTSSVFPAAFGTMQPSSHGANFSAMSRVTNDGVHVNPLATVMSPSNVLPGHELPIAYTQARDSGVNPLVTFDYQYRFED